MFYENLDGGKGGRGVAGSFQRAIVAGMDQGMSLQGWLVWAGLVLGEVKRGPGEMLKRGPGLGQQRRSLV